MNCSTLKTLVLASALALSVGIVSVHADPVVIGDPAKGTPITTIKDGKNKVNITTTGISIDDNEISEELTAAAKEITGNSGGKFVIQGGSKLEDILVPVAFFLFLVSVILGGKYISSRNEQRRLELLKLMVQNGQPVPEAVVNQILAPQATPEGDSARQEYKRTRNAYGFTVAGVGLVLYALASHEWSSGTLVPALVFLCLGVGGLAGLYLPKRSAGKTLN